MLGVQVAHAAGEASFDVRRIASRDIQLQVWHAALSGWPRCLASSWRLCLALRDPVQLRGGSHDEAIAGHRRRCERHLAD